MSIVLRAAIAIPLLRSGLALVLAAAALTPVAVPAQDEGTNSSLPTLGIANVSVAEGAGSVSVTVTLSAESAQSVTVAYSGIDGTATEDDGDYTLTDGTLSIPARSTTGTIPLTIHGDDVDEADETFRIRLSSPANAVFAGDASTIESTVTITDDDTRGISVSPTSLKIDESRDGLYSVWLDSEPTATVTVTPSVHGDTDVTVSGALTFTTDNWNTAQKVIVSTAIDADDDDDAATIRHAVSGGDYASVAASNVSVLVKDYVATSTAVRLLVNPTSVSEGDGETTITVNGRLNGLPRDSDTTVTVSVGASTDSAIEGTDYSSVDDLTLTIKEGEVSASVTFKLTPIENDVDESAPSLSVYGSTQGLSVFGDNVQISDNDTRGLELYRDRVPINEGESRVYLIGMLSEPTADVTVTPSIKWADDHVAVSLSGAVTFTPDNWDEAKRVTVTAVDDPDAVSGKVSISHSVSGGDYAPVKLGDMRVEVTDDETRGVTFSETYQALDEGLNATYTVVLEAQPIVDVVTVTPSIKSRYGTPATVSGALTFTADDWDEAQTVTVTLGQDVDGEDGQVVIEHDVTGGAYALLRVDDVTVRVTDDETQSSELIVTVDPRSITEGAGETTVTVTAALDAAPFSTTQPITLGVGWPSSQFTVHSVSPSGAAYLNAGESSFTRTYSVTPIDDEYFDRPVRLVISARMFLDESPLYAYLSLRGATALFLHDNDTPPGVTISDTSVTVGEGDSTTYTVVLDSKPRTDVTVRPYLTSAYTDVTISGKLTFTGDNWDEPQSITVTAAQDEDAADDSAEIRHAVEGGAYGSVYPDNVTVTVDDDETAGITLSTTALVIDEGGRGTYRVGVLSRPTEAVTVTLSVEGDADVTVRASSTAHGPGMVFHSSLWGTQTVWVTAAHDSDALDDTAVIRHTVIAGGEYASATVEDVMIAVDDDEIPPDLPLNLDAIAGDNTVNVAEKAAGFTIGGDTGSEASVDVTVTVGSAVLTATSADADPATWSVSVPANASYVTGSSVDVAVSASKTGYTSNTVTRSLGVDLTPPTAPTYTVPGSLKVDEPITSVSPSGGSGIDAYSASELPSGLSIDASTGVISGTPDTADANTASVTVTVSDNAGNADTVGLTFPAVAKGDQAFTRFVYNSTPVTLGLPAPRLLTPTGAKTAVSYSALPAAVCTVDATTGELTIVGVGECVITATAAETDNYNQATATFTLTVRAPTPGLTAPTYTAPSSLKVGVRITPMSPSGGTAINRFSATGLPPGLSIDTGTGVISGTPTAANANTVTATVTVSGTPSNTRSVMITFPAVAKGDQTLSGFRYSASSVTLGSGAPTVTEPNGAQGTVLYSASPSTVCTVDLSTGELTLIGAGTCRITATAVSSSNYNEGTATFTLTVAAQTVGRTQKDNSSNTGTVEVEDDDNVGRGVTVSPAALTVAEGASATYSLVLDSEPSDTVTVTPAVSGSPDVTFKPPSLTFTTSGWDRAQTVTLEAAEDGDAYHDSAIVSHSAKGGDYEDYTGGYLPVTVSDNEAESPAGLPAQVTGLSSTSTSTYVDLTWTAVGSPVLGYRIEASYDGGANWIEVEANTGNTVASWRHDVGLNFSETRRYRVSAVNANGVGLPSAFLRVTATALADGLTATARMPDDSADSMSGDSGDTTSADIPDPAPSIDLCWIPEGVAASDLSAVAVATSPVSASGSGGSGNLTWQSIGSGSTDVDCQDGTGFRTTSIGANQRYAFRMRASHAGAWLLSNVAEAVLADSTKPLRSVVTADSSGLSGDSRVPDPVCRDYDDPATTEDEAGSFFVSIGFTTASAEFLRYEPVDGFNIESDLALANATAELVDQPYDTLLGYRVRITPRVWGSPVSISVPADVVTHAETAVGNQASGSFRRDTSDEVDCTTSAPVPARRAQVTGAQIEHDGDRDGEWVAGEPIRVTLQFNERVSVDTTDGVPGVTLTLGAAQSETTDVTALFTRVAHEDTLVFEYLVTADESPVRDIALVADSLALNDGQIDSVTGPAVDLAHPGATVTDGQIAQPDLTADWSMIPASHGGSESEFEVRLRFSEAVDLIEVIGEANLIEHAFTVTNGSIGTIRHIRDRQGEYLAREWALSVVADSEEPVTVAPVVDLACGQPGAICTVDDRTLAEAPSAIVHRTEQTLSVADAEVNEGPGAELVFEVTLARPADRTVTVGYQTRDGTAKAGEDYEDTSGTLNIDAGQSTASIRVLVLDDTHNEGEETLTLHLTDPVNARLLDDVAAGAIVNSDPMPSAWLARFGRAASDHVMQAVARRLERGQGEDRLRVGGTSLDRLYTKFAAPHAGSAASVPPHAKSDPFAPDAARSPAPDGSTRHALGPQGSKALPSLREALTGSSFFYTYGEAEDGSSGSGPLTAWGETASTRFSGSEGALNLDGDVTTAILGLDKQYGRWLVGTTLSYSEGDGGYRRSGDSGGSGGSIESTLTSLNPYAHYQLSESASLWGVIGYGAGRMQLLPDGAEYPLETDLSNRMAAFGGRGVLSVRAGDSGRFELALRSDALLTRTDSEAVQGLTAARGGTSRVRLLLEGSGSLPVRGGTLRPTVEAGLRYDGGDAETGAGLEVGGGLAYGTGRFSVEVNARSLVAHEDADYEEWGLSGSLVYRARDTGRGLSMKLGSAWGAARSGVQSLWTRPDASGLVPGAAMDRGQRFQAEFGYGLAGRKGRALWAPFLAAETGQGGQQSLRMGLKLTSGDNIEAGLEIGQQGSARGEARHAIQLRGSMRW